MRRLVWLWAWSACSEEGGVLLAQGPLLNQANGWDFQAEGPVAHPLDLRCSLRSDPEELHQVQLPPARAHRVALYGLLADEVYDCQLTFGSRGWEGAIETPPLPDFVPRFEVSGPWPGWGEYLLFSHGRSGEPDRQQKLVVIDRQGRVRYVLPIPLNPPDLDFGLDGEEQWLYGGGMQHPPTVVNFAGTVLNQAIDSTKGEPYHHHTQRLPDGSVLALAAVWHRGEGPPYLGFSVEWLERGLHARRWSYTSHQGLAAGWLKTPVPGRTDDPWHANALYPLPDGDVLLSLRQVSQLHRLDPESGERVWSLGPGKDFQLLKADGSPAPASDWFYGQHAPKMDGDRLLVYDNGVGRPRENYSRVAEFRLDEAARTATLLWDYREDGWFTPIWGDADWLPDGDVLVVRAVCAGCGAGPGERTQLMQVDPERGEVVWRLTHDEVRDTGYRATRLSGCALFHNRQLCADDR